MRLHGDEFVQLSNCVWDSLGFIVEQLHEARSPPDQLAAVDAAKGIIRHLQSRLARDERIQARVALCFPFNPYVLDPFWQDHWTDLANNPASDFAIKSDGLIECLGPVPN